MTSSERETARLDAHRDTVRGAERQDPLRRRVLAALEARALTPTELSELLGSPTESISRTLKELLEAGQLEKQPDAADRRLRRYSLSGEGMLSLGEYRAFGAPEPPPSPPRSTEVRSFLGRAMKQAVRLRRNTNELNDARERLRRIVDRAESSRSSDLALDALFELATTLRQNQEFGEVESLLKRLGEIAGGVDAYGSGAVMPATAHLEYTMGRMGDHRGEDLLERANHLIAAASLYGQLAKIEPPRHLDWSSRRAWSLVSLAGNLRKQSNFEDALVYADLAFQIFDSLEDDYGRSHCFFMFGYLLRLLGDYDESWASLNRAFELAESNDFRRFAADSLMQMGEVRRCQGNSADARIHLNEALNRSSEMDLRVTQAFAYSALGAVEYQEQEAEGAKHSLGIAHEIFDRCGRVEGLALNARRHATIIRVAASKRSQLDPAVEMIDFARNRYLELRGPAGVAACEIEAGRLQIQQADGEARTVDEVVRQLHDLLLDEHRRDLELDPWVPCVFNSFACEVEDEDLLAQTRTLLSSAKELLADRAAPTAKRVAEVIGEVPKEDLPESPAAAAEMGGEARLNPRPFKFAALPV